MSDCLTDPRLRFHRCSLPSLVWIINSIHIKQDFVLENESLAYDHTSGDNNRFQAHIVAKHQAISLTTAISHLLKPSLNNLIHMAAVDFKDEKEDNI